MTIQFEAQLDGFDSTYHVHTTQFITFRTCGDGEVLKGNICQQCPSGSYSFTFDPLEECKPCPALATGCLGSQISVPNGYWRLSPSSNLLLPCPFVKGCKGSSLNYTATTTNGGSGGLTSADVTTGVNNRRRLTHTTHTKLNEYCAVGYEGPLCAVCSKGFYLDYGLKQCISCVGQVVVVVQCTLTLDFSQYLNLAFLVPCFIHLPLHCFSYSISHTFSSRTLSHTPSHTPQGPGQLAGLILVPSIIFILAYIAFSYADNIRAYIDAHINTDNADIDSNSPSNKTTSSRSYKKHFVRMVAHELLMPKLKNIIATFQILSIFPEALDIEFPPYGANALYGIR